MTNGEPSGALHQLRRLVAADGGARPDRDLLERFVRHRDEAAFAALVRRHGPMVHGVCRRVLGDAHDAEDACQATFLALARKAGSIRNRASVGGWLHGVAYRVAANLKRQVARRHAREVPAAEEPQVEPAEPSWREVRAVLDEEIARLPERLRAPLLLCYVEEKTRDEAAQELGWSLGTLRGRLERGRELLRRRLTRRGVTLSAALLAALLTRHATAALAAPLAARVVRAAAGEAAGAVPARVAALTEGVLQAMFVNRLRTIAAVVAILGVAGLGAGLLAGGMRPPEPLGGDGAAPPPGVEAAADDAAAGAAAADRAEPAPSPGAAAQSRMNLKKLALAMHEYADVHGQHFPAPAIYGGGTGSRPGGAAGMMTPGTGGRGAPGGPGGAPGLQGGAPGGGGGAGGPPGGGGGSPMGGGGGSPTVPGASAAGTPGGLGGSGVPGGGSMGAMAPGGVPGMGTAPDGIRFTGTALLSWRVALLPYLGEEKLYRQFRLNEPWDSPHNKALLAKMPQVYAPPGVQTRQQYTTCYQVFVGPHAGFEKHRALRFPVAFLDGTSNTLLIVEAESPVPWTKPEDLHYAPDEPLPELGGLFPGIFNAAFADGSVYPLRKNADPVTLRRLITRDDGYPVDRDKVRAPASRREAELQRENGALKHSLEAQQAELNELRRELQELGAPEDSPETEQLKKENEQLRRSLEQTQAEARRVRDEIRRLKQSRPGNPAGPGGK